MYKNIFKNKKIDHNIYSAEIKSKQEYIFDITRKKCASFISIEFYLKVLNGTGRMEYRLRSMCTHSNIT